MTESPSIIDASKIRVQLLNKENYYIWSNKLELILRGKGLWEIVNGTELAPATESTSESSTTTATVNSKKFQQRKGRALTTILFNVEDFCLSHVTGDREPKVFWDKLKSMYKSTSEANVDTYLSRDQAINMEPSESVMAYVSKLPELENE